MKKIKKSLFYYGLILFVSIVYESCFCPGPTIFELNYCELNVYNLDNSGEEPIISDSYNIPKNAYGIQVNLVKDTCNYSPPISFKPVFVSSAYAFSCKDKEENVENHLNSFITGIQVITLNNFDSQHSANSDVTGLFYVYNGKDELTKVDEYFEKYYEENYEKFVSQSGILTDWDEDKFTLLLMQAPEFNDEQKFKVNVFFKLRNGIEETLSQTTSPVILN